MFLTTIGHGLSNRMIQERFQHSGESVSRWFEIVLDVVCLMSVDIIKPSDPQFKEVPDKIRNDDRKGVTTQNVMAVCDFNMCFTFAWAEWEGAAHDARVFLEALRRPELGFPHPPRGPYKGERYHLPDFRRGSSPKEMHSFPLEKQVKIVIASMALHNFIRINARMDMEFKPYDVDQGLLPLNEEESRVDSLVEEDGSHHTREMEEQRDRIANLLISH
ncbi:hypothetical protein CK203_076739 [Vitis vinifera]|uniref:DUF8040 domain-containing protein n=1 Tax=Vitis vinifera TaxID=29760 RepID=A0A438EPJ4_VITVI|nr:hypothetical protein CK203_076739 [Vitis vinifera]